jgi:hypothetical protein
MHILYVDDSGSVDNPTEAHFVLGGISVFERGLYHQIKLPMTAYPHLIWAIRTT